MSGQNACSRSGVKFNTIGFCSHFFSRDADDGRPSRREPSANTLVLIYLHQIDVWGDSLRSSWRKSSIQQFLPVLLLVSGLRNVSPASAGESEPVSSDTTTQIQHPAQNSIAACDVYPLADAVLVEKGANTRCHNSRTATKVAHHVNNVLAEKWSATVP